MKQFVKVSNAVLSLQLSSKALFVYLHLMERMSLLHGVTVSVDTLTQVTGLSARTVRGAIAELVQHELLSKTRRYKTDGYYAANRYYITIPAGGWFKFPVEALHTTITPTQVTVLAFVLRCMDEKGEAFPSLRRIQAATGMSRTSICAALAHLRQYSYLNRIHRRYKRTRAHRHNRYRLFLSGKGKRACIHNMQAPQKIKVVQDFFYINMVHQTPYFVKCKMAEFFLC